MNSSKNQELIIVNAISQMVIPSDIFEKSEFKEIISNFKKAQNNVSESLKDIELARKDVEDGNLLGNWWHDRKDKLQEAQLDLNKSVGLLTKQSSDLILFNTAISKVLVSQQKVLHEQQEILKAQAGELAAQNISIKEHQIKISAQQEEIVKANDGLLEAKGVTREQAEKLVGCVKRVEAAEQKMEGSNQELERAVLARIIACEGRAESIKAEVNEVLYSYHQEAANRLEELGAEYNTAFENLRDQLSDFESKIHAESEVRNLAVTSVAEEFNQQVYELQNKQVVSGKKLLSELDSAKEMSASQITALASSFDKHEFATAVKHKQLLYYSISALIFSVLSLATSVYVSLGG